MLHVFDEGRGRPVLLLHGCPIPSDYLVPLVEALDGHRRILRVDLPGYGRSPRLEGEYTLDRVTQLLVDELERRGVRELDIVGHSLGVYRALALALSGRVEVGTLLGWGGFAGLDPEVSEKYGELAAAFRTGALTPDALVPAAFARGFVESHPAEAEACRRLVASVPASVAAVEFEAVARAADLRPNLCAVKARVVLRTGELDQSVLPTWSEAIANRVAGAELQIAAGAGHMLLFENREETLASARAALGIDNQAGRAI